ncbi:hypothetical protein SCLCIDRAFT_1219407 [Scleroderma citrinum Foug A]|uniref:Uncharacterized protein n=1 Tax=Scleroderma citrinum Foug A TaxID=1036808 RepID=A0A0C3DMM7_9AGAM|nr:hypothetical protein SCLCIDRAFT_1219407 [Scleroderma citrinum Foug A]
MAPPNGSSCISPDGLSEIPRTQILGNRTERERLTSIIRYLLEASSPRIDRS